jgi:phage tail-like protein
MGGYRFATAAQWSTCLFDGADRGGASQAQTGLRPIAPFERSGRLYPSKGAHAPAVTRTDEVLWCDDDGQVHRLAGEDQIVICAPYAIASATRLISCASGLWVVIGNSLLRFEEDTLTQLAAVEFADGRLIDVAGDPAGGVFVLAEFSGTCQCVRVDCSGRTSEAVTFDGISNASGFVQLVDSGVFVVLTKDPEARLSWYPVEGGASSYSLAVAAVHPCFSASALGCDSHSRVFLAGADGVNFGGAPYVLIFDADGVQIAEIALDTRDGPVSGAAGTQTSLWVTGPRGLLRYSVSSVVPEETAAVRCSMLTPLLLSPVMTTTGQWLRVEATANLPDGATLEISYAAVTDSDLRSHLSALLADTTQLPGRRVQRVLQEPDIWSAPLAFPGLAANAGSGGGSGNPEGLYTAPLFDVRAGYLWVCVTLTATAGGGLPSLSRLAVLYAGPSLMDQLPAIYRRSAAQPGDFLRSLVGVLESTTQGLDSRIGALGSYIDPSHAQGPWLDFVARWLGLPWDDALDESQKRCILSHATGLGRERGTRSGLEILLQCLLPEGQFRVIDATADCGFAVVGGAQCPGSALPAILAARTPWNTELDSSSVLGRMRLPCAGQVDDPARELAGHVRVDIAASAGQRLAWEPWLLGLINEMVPVTARVQLTWLALGGMRPARLSDSLTIEAPPVPHLGTDAVIGIARLPERGGRITGIGADVGVRLQ